MLVIFTLNGHYFIGEDKKDFFIEFTMEDNALAWPRTYNAKQRVLKSSSAYS